MAAGMPARWRAIAAARRLAAGEEDMGSIGVFGVQRRSSEEEEVGPSESLRCGAEMRHRSSFEVDKHISNREMLSSLKQMDKKKNFLRRTFDKRRKILKRRKKKLTRETCLA